MRNVGSRNSKSLEGVVLIELKRSKSDNHGISHGNNHYENICTPDVIEEFG